MAFGTITLQPGINTQVSQFENRQGWSASQLIRWKDGHLEKLGGWLRLSSTPLIGVCRGLHAWASLNGTPYLIAGTDQRVQLFDGGIIEDITPLRATTNPAPDFSTTIGTKKVTVHDVGHGALTGDWINLITQVAVGGLLLYGFYSVTTVDADHYTIQSPTNATATVVAGGVVPAFTTTNTLTPVSVALPNHGQTIGSLFFVGVSTTIATITIVGYQAVTAVADSGHFTIIPGGAANATTTASENAGNARIQYLIHSGFTSPQPASGYGAGDYGAGDYGGANGSSGVITKLRQWFFDTWGGDAIGNYTNGPLYIWIPPYSTNPFATVITQAPSMMVSSFVAMPEEIVVSLGAEIGGNQDPLLVRWSDSQDYTVWTASSANQAGSFRLTAASRIVGGLQGPLQAYIWTDLDLWVMQYLQPPLVFGFNKIAEGCGLIAARAAAVMGGSVYWMGPKQFFTLGAYGVQAMPCTVWDKVFKNLNTTQVDKIFAAFNSLYQEIAWYYPSASGNGEVDSYVKVNVVSGLWDYGSLVRTAWEDESAIGYPVGVDQAGLIQQHETSPDADGQPLIWYAQSGYSDLSDGENFVFVDQIIPDLIRSQGSIVNLTPSTLETPINSTAISYGPYQISDSSGYISTRIRGRLLSFMIGSQDMGSTIRLGLIRFRSSVDGRR